jgi:hypothetical protein
MRNTIFLATLVSLISCKKLDIKPIDKIATGSFQQKNDTIILAGEIIDENSNGILQYGHCWSKNNTPTLLNSDYTVFTSYEIGRAFESKPFNLDFNTDYYYRTYAISNSNDTNYFELRKMTIDSTFLNSFTVQIDSIRTLNLSSVQLYASVKHSGQINIEEQGVVSHLGVVAPSTAVLPTTYANEITNNTFQSVFSSLTLETTYYYWAFVKPKGANRIYSEHSNRTIKDIQLSTLDFILNGQSAVISGEIQEIGFYPITNYGFCYSNTNSSPNFNSSRIELGSANNIGTFNGDFIVESGVNYYYRAFAVRNNQVVYGEIKTIQQ